MAWVAAVVQVQSLAGEFPHVMGAAGEKKKKKQEGTVRLMANLYGGNITYLT